eukprot:CAMPEP_0117440742 /NCGR_PEP_ID=MMETSP0759-20121206/3254_1 /TAXON_ID=63605 /ORGANISM="Percolomonas cosmopolitus, Strain WS" /LENGTH=803 /DNA_ID=CAMNT_0005232531 /DNA_START=187 /DNA_END=2598 /DNA_ORIENTATION=-
MSDSNISSNHDHSTVNSLEEQSSQLAHIQSPSSISLFSLSELKFIDAQTLFKDFIFEKRMNGYIPLHLLILSGKWKDASRVTNLRDLKPQTVYFVYNLNEKVLKLDSLPQLDALQMDGGSDAPPADSLQQTYDEMAQRVAHFNNLIKQRWERTNRQKFCISAAHALHQFISNWRTLIKNALQVSLEHQDEIMRISHSGVIQKLKDVVLPQNSDRNSPGSRHSSLSDQNSHHNNSSSSLLSSSPPASLASSHQQVSPPQTLYDILPPNLQNFHYEKTRSDVLQHFQILNEIKTQFDHLHRNPDVKSLKASENFLDSVRKLIAEQSKLNHEFRHAHRHAVDPTQKYVNYASLLEEVAVDMDSFERKMEILASKALSKIEKLLLVYQELRRIDSQWADHRSSMNREETATCLAAAKLPDIYKQYLREMTRRSIFVRNTQHEISKFRDVISELRLDENRRRNEFLERMLQSQPLVANILGDLIPEIRESVPEIYFEFHYHEEIPEKYLVKESTGKDITSHTAHMVESDDDTDYSSEHIGYLETRVQELQEKLKQQEETKQQLVQSLESSSQSLEEKYKSENQNLKDRLSNTESELSVLRSSHESELEKSQLQLHQYTQRLESYEKEHIHLAQSKLKQVDAAFEEFAQNTKRIHTDYQEDIDKLKSQVDKSKEEKQLYIQQIASLERELAQATKALRQNPTSSNSPVVDEQGKRSKSALEQIISEKDDLIASLRARLEKDRQLSESRLDQSIITHKSVEHERDYLKSDNEKLRQRLQESRDKQVKSNEMIEKLCEMVDELKEKLGDST